MVGLTSRAIAGSASSATRYKLPVDVPLTDADFSAYAEKLGTLSLGHGEVRAGADGIVETLLRPADDAPKQLFSLSLTPDRDRFLGEDALVALNVVTYPSYVAIDYAETGAVWRNLGESIATEDAAWVFEQKAAIDGDDPRRESAVAYPSSLDGRIQASNSQSATAVAFRRLATESAAFALCQLGDYGGLRTGSGWGEKALRRLYQLCKGNMSAIWDTLKEEGVDGFYGNTSLSPFCSFLFPLVRQFIVPFVPAEAPSLAAAAAATSASVYLVEGQLPTTLRRKAIAALLPLLPPTSATTVEELDQAGPIFPVLNLLQIVPAQGFIAETPPSDAALPRSWPFGPGLHDAPLARPLMQSSWSFDHFAPEGTDASTDALLRAPGLTAKAASTSIETLRAQFRREDDETRERVFVMPWDRDREIDADADGEDDSDAVAEEEDGLTDDDDMYEITPEEDARMRARASATALERHRRERQETLDRLHALLQERFPNLRDVDPSRIPFKPTCATMLVSFLENEEFFHRVFQPYHVRHPAP